jgi:hypothetical protein
VTRLQLPRRPCRRLDGPARRVRLRARDVTGIGCRAGPEDVGPLRAAPQARSHHATPSVSAVVAKRAREGASGAQERARSRWETGSY